MHPRTKLLALCSALITCAFGGNCLSPPARAEEPSAAVVTIIDDLEALAEGVDIAGTRYSLPEWNLPSMGWGCFQTTWRVDLGLLTLPWVRATSQDDISWPSIEGESGSGKALRLFSYLDTGHSYWGVYPESTGVHSYLSRSDLPGRDFIALQPYTVSGVQHPARFEVDVQLTSTAPETIWAVEMLGWDGDNRRVIERVMMGAFPFEPHSGKMYVQNYSPFGAINSGSPTILHFGSGSPVPHPPNWPAGGYVPIPNAPFRLICELSAAEPITDPPSYNSKLFIRYIEPDSLPGGGDDQTTEWLIHQVENVTLSPTSNRFGFDTWGVRSDFSHYPDAIYLDHVKATGIRVLPFSCAVVPPCNDPQIDTLSDLTSNGGPNGAPLRGQTERWGVPVDQHADVTVVTAGGSSDKRINVAPITNDPSYAVSCVTDADDHPRDALPFEAWKACADMGYIPGGGTINPFALALRSRVDGLLAARVFVKWFDWDTIGVSAAPPVGDVLVQSNEAFNPITPYDHDLGQPPAAAHRVHPGVNAARSLVAAAGTGGGWGAYVQDILGDTFPQLCIEVTSDNTLSVMLNDQLIYPVGGDANPVDAFHSHFANIFFEHAGAISSNSTIQIDNVTSVCVDTGHIGAAYPLFTLPYHDDLQWGIVGIPIGMHDTGDPAKPFRWVADRNTRAFRKGIGASPVDLRLSLSAPSGFLMPSIGPAPALYGQDARAMTYLPPATPTDGVRGWSAEAQILMESALTDRTWVVGHTLEDESTVPIGALRLVTGTTPKFQVYRGGAWSDTSVQVAPVAGRLMRVQMVYNPDAVTLGDGSRNAMEYRVAVADANQALGATTLLDRAPTMSDPATERTMGSFTFYNRILGEVEIAPVSNCLVDEIFARWACPGDTDANGAVDFIDLNNVLGQMGQTGVRSADADANGVVGFTDLNIVLSSMGMGTCPYQTP